MNNNVPDILFEYLKNIIYDPGNAKLDLHELPEEYQELGQGLMFLHQCVNEQKLFGKTLISGDFEHNVPGIENVIAAPLKEVHGILKHVIWQTGQVAKGDYSQRLEYFGDFSNSFNTMVTQLKERQENLETERNNLSARNKELTHLQDLFKELTIDAPYLIIVTDNKTKEIQYLNNEAKRVKNYDRVLFDYLYNNVITEFEIDYILHVKDIIPFERHYHITSNKSVTGTNESVIYVISDVTDEVNEDKELENLAYRDELTGLPNRRFGMKLIDDLINENRKFSIGFIDIDYLKYCNDVFGHNAGDRYIKEITDQLKKVTGEKTICRVGGDEFLIIKTNTTMEELYDELFKLRQDIIDNHSDEHVESFSFGTENFDPEVDNDVSAKLSKADERMYHFKVKHKQKINYKDDR